MKAFQKVAGAARKRLFRRSVKEEANKMDPVVRTALVEDVSPATALQLELEEIEAEITKARESLRAAEEKEVFLGQRSRQYRRALDERARQLKEEQARLDAQNEQLQNQQQQEDDDEEEGAADRVDQDELDRKMEKWENDEDALVKIVETHKQILGHCETMRWKIKELEAKRKSCRSMIAECTDFLDAAEQVRNDIHREADEAAAAAARAEENNQTQADEYDPMIQVINDDSGANEDKDKKDLTV